jgi:hypothetical protein
VCNCILLLLPLGVNPIAANKYIISLYARPLFKVRSACHLHSNHLSYLTLMTQVPSTRSTTHASHDLSLLNICTTLMFLFSALHSYILLYSLCIKGVFMFNTILKGQTRVSNTTSIITCYISPALRDFDRSRKQASHDNSHIYSLEME